MPYKNGSKSSAALARELSNQLKYKVIQLRTNGSKYVPKQRHIIVNWGSSKVPDWLIPNVRIINHPENVLKAANKLHTFQALAQAEFPHVPEWTTDQELVHTWIEKGFDVVVRHKLTGHSGEGIEIVNHDEFIPHHQKLPDAPLYVKYVKKLKEFRIHVAFREILDVQEKRRRSDGASEADSRIRNHHTGWVYCRNEIVEPEGIRQIAIDAIAALGLDFGAVDVIYNQKQNRCYVLEVNTACGLEGTTLQNYVKLIVEKANEGRI